MNTKTFLDVDGSDTLHRDSQRLSIPEGTFCGDEEIALPPGTFHAMDEDWIEEIEIDPPMKC